MFLQLELNMLWFSIFLSHVENMLLYARDKRSSNVFSSNNYQSELNCQLCKVHNVCTIHKSCTLVMKTSNMEMCFTIYHEITNLYSQIANLQDLRISLFLAISKQTMEVDRTKEGHTVTIVTDSRWKNVHNSEEPLIVCIHLHISIFLCVCITQASADSLQG